MNLPSLYAIIDQEVSESYGWKVPQLARAFLAGGAQLLQVRVSTAGSGEFLSWCDEVIKEAKLFGAQVMQEPMHRYIYTSLEPTMQT